MDQNLKRLIDALNLAQEEHGRPNTFTPGFLAAEYTKLTAPQIGKLAPMVSRLWRKYGGKGSAPSYEKHVGNQGRAFRFTRPLTP